MYIIVKTLETFPKEHNFKTDIKKQNIWPVQCFTSVIPATWEAKIRRIMVQGQSR
jgi:hypothetical protein